MDNKITFEMVNGDELTLDVDVAEVGESWWDDLEDELDSATWFRFTTGTTVYFFKRDQLRSITY